MTTIVTITRHHSQFRNVADTYELGNHDISDTSVERYVLPDGYWIDNQTNEVRDPHGYLCTIEARGGKGAPQIMSLAGPMVETMPVLAPAR